MNYSERVIRIELSATVAVGNLAADLCAEGVDVVDLSVGEPDFETPQNIVKAGKRAMDEGHTGYTSSNGVPGLREAICEKLDRDGVVHDPGEVIVTPSAKQALFETVQALVDPGDEVVLIEPAWVSYRPMLSMTGGRITTVETQPHDFQLEPALDDLGEAVDDETELLVVNSPSNPTGAVYSESALEGVRDIAVAHDVTILSDEIYGEIAYDVDPTSPAGLDGMGDRTVTVNGFSKAYAMTGWRLGYRLPRKAWSRRRRKSTHTP
jgi:aspartate aminotransferase